MLVTLITTTGYRPEAFKLCQKFIKDQTYKDAIQWIVVSDSGETITDKRIEFYKGPRTWQPGFNTQRYNLEVALEHAKGDRIFFIEDDDYYHPDYLKTWVEILNHASIVGVSSAKYYNLQVPGWKILPNRKHAGLYSTAIRKEILPLFNLALHSGELYIDVKLWKLVEEKEFPSALLNSRNLSIGVKGLPGRAGIGIGHVEKDYQYDPSLSKLTEWVGSSMVETYKPFIKPTKGEGKWKSVRETSVVTSTISNQMKSQPKKLK